MIVKASISNFKGIQNCKIQGLSPINLFIGKNNTCKSSILEAIYYTLKETQTPSLGELVTRRTNVSFSARELWYNYQVQNNIGISLNFSNTTVSMDIEFKENFKTLERSILVKPFYKGGTSSVKAVYTLTLDVGTQIHVGQQLFDGLRPRDKKRIATFAKDCTLLDSSSRKDIKSTENLLGELKLRQKTNELGTHLNDIFGTGTTWEFLPLPDKKYDEKEYRAAIMVNDRPMFLSGLGDGFRYGLQIIGSAMLLNNTAVFIEEIESHQHLEALKKMIPCLVDYSKKNGLQFFLTTHNYNVWRLFEHEFPDEKERNKYFKPYLVTRNAENGAVDCTPQTKENADEFWSKVDEELSGK